MVVRSCHSMPRQKGSDTWQMRELSTLSSFQGSWSMTTIGRSILLRLRAFQRSRFSAWTGREAISM